MSTDLIPAEVARLHARGFRLLPIKRDTKEPATDGFAAKDGLVTWADPADYYGREIAILTGPYGGKAALLCIDFDGSELPTEIDGAILPPTLTSKKGRHRWYIDPTGTVRQQNGWRPKVDVKAGLGAYAIETKNGIPLWDNPDAVPAMLPPELLALLPRTGDRPARPAPRPRPTQPMGDVDALVAALAAAWPQPGGECHNAALALGGALAVSSWDEDDVAAFAGALFATTGTKDRTADVLDSCRNARAGVETKDVAALVAILKAADRGNWKAAIEMLKDGIPELRPPSPAAVVQDESARRAAKPTDEPPLAVGDEHELAMVLRGEWDDPEDRERVFLCHGKLAGDVVCQGELWTRTDGGPCWRARTESEIYRLLTSMHGAMIRPKAGRGGVLRLPPSLAERVKTSLVAVGPAREDHFDHAPGVAFANGWVDAASGTFTPWADCNVNVRRVLPFDYVEGGAPTAPVWERFLESVWGVDPEDEDSQRDEESIQLVHEMLGCALAGDLRAQKIFLLIGPVRAGKGTLFQLLEDILGRPGYTPFKVAALANNFGLQGIVGAASAVDPDVRFRAWQNGDPIVERLLSISANDAQAVPRKNIEDWKGRLGVQLWLATNPPFKPEDASHALASRFVILPFTRSFLGREDTGLPEKLRAEIPAIVARALAAYRDGYLKRGCRFVEPEAAGEARGELDLMAGFFAACCELGAGYTDHPTEFQTAARDWVAVERQTKLANDAYSAALKQRGIRRARAPRGIEGRPWWLWGARRRPRPEA